MDQKLLTLIHTVCCTLLLIFAFLILCPLAVLLRNFNGHCILGAHIDFPDDSNNMTVARDLATAHSKCTYPEFMGFMVLFFSIVYLVWNTFLILNSWQSPGRDSFAGSIISGIFAFMLLVSSCILSARLNKLCKQFEQGGHNCEEDSDRQDHWLTYLNYQSQVVAPIDPEGFYTLAKLAEVASWLAFVTMLGMFAVYLVKLKTSSAGTEFLSALSAERTRIIPDNQKRYDQI